MRPRTVSLDDFLKEAITLDIRHAQPERQNHALIISDDKIGTVQMERQLLSGIHLSRVHWQVGAQDLLIQDNTRSDDININLQLKGHLHTRYKSLEKPLDMQRGRHNLIRVYEAGGLHQAKAGEQLEMFHLSLQPNNFIPFLDPQEALGDSLLQKLEKQESFAASPMPLSITPDMLAVVANLCNCGLQGHTRRMYLEAKVGELLCLLLDGYTRPLLRVDKLPRRQDAEKLHALREYLHRHYLLPHLSLTGLGREFGLNECSLKKGFKQLFSTTVFGYVHQLRMDHARLLMLEGGLTVSEAADALGYANPQHFSTAYKKQFGISPGMLVKTIR